MLLVVLLFSLLVTLSEAAGHSDSSGNAFTFVGDEHWTEQYREQCDQPRNIPYTDESLKCYTYMIHLHTVNVELLSTDPVLVVYRKFANPYEVKGFLDHMQKIELEQQGVQDHVEKTVQHSSRIANGSWVDHEADEGVLSYNPGGHYAPHLDMLQYHSEDQWDGWMRDFGNRFATFLIVLKTADKGGSTVFNKLDMTVKPEAGDVIFWQNQHINLTQHELSMHGACPIYEGQKIAATLWIREKNQPLMERGGETMDYTVFIDPKRIQGRRDISNWAYVKSNGFARVLETMFKWISL